MLHHIEINQSDVTIDGDVLYEEVNGHRFFFSRRGFYVDVLLKNNSKKQVSKIVYTHECQKEYKKRLPSCIVHIISADPIAAHIFSSFGVPPSIGPLKIRISPIFKNILFIGTSSSGKSTLVKKLSIPSFDPEGPGIDSSGRKCDIDANQYRGNISPYDEGLSFILAKKRDVICAIDWTGNPEPNRYNVLVYVSLEQMCQNITRRREYDFRGLWAFDVFPWFYTTTPNYLIKNQKITNQKVKNQKPKTTSSSTSNTSSLNNTRAPLGIINRIRFMKALTKYNKFLFYDEADLQLFAIGFFRRMGIIDNKDHFVYYKRPLEIDCIINNEDMSKSVILAEKFIGQISSLHSV